MGTDIYSFGVLLYEVVVGRVPFTADTPYSIIHDHIYSPLPPPRSVNPNVPEGVERVLLKALAKERVDRFATVEALVEAFKSALASILAPIPASQAAPLPPVVPALAQEEKPAVLPTSETVAIPAVSAQPASRLPADSVASPSSPLPVPQPPVPESQAASL
jgi:serine/threonine-protein kinase